MLGDSLYLDNIEEYVQDENQIVTYKWLSRTLEVPVNIAKQMLYSYVSRCRKSPSDHPINVTYLVSGVSDKQGHRVCLVEESDLEDTKKQFSTLLGLHVYSVQKHKLKDSSLLYIADYDIGEEHIRNYSKWSPIECTVDVKRPNIEEQKSTPAEPAAKPPLPKLSHMGDSDSNQGIAASATQPVKEEKPKKLLKVSSKPKSAPKGSVMSFFNSKSEVRKKEAPANKAEPKPQSQQREPEPPLTRAPVLSSSKLKAAQPKIVPPSQIKTSKSKASGLFGGLNDSDIDDEDSDEEKTPSPKQIEATSKKTKRNVRANEIQENSKDEQQQKRRRVQELSSDEETVGNEVNHKAAGIELSVSGAKRRKKVRRLVPKLYTNDNGEMVTERSWETVSTDASDEGDEEPSVETKKPKVETKSEKLSPKKTKQASIKNFFKK